MFKSPKIILSLVMGFVVVALVAGIGFVAMGSNPANAAALEQAQATTPATSTTGNNSSKQKGQKGELRQTFINNFASALGVSPDKLNSSFTSAVGQTVDQAVKDGKLTQQQADAIKQRAQQGFKGGFGAGKHGQAGHNLKGKVGNVLKDSADATAKALGISTDELKTDLKNGQSIADIAKAKNVDLQTVKTAMLSSFKSNLDTAVKDGKLTQQQADNLYQKASSKVDTLVTRSFKGGKKANQ